MVISRIGADSDGKSYWSESQTQFTAVDYAPPLPPLQVSEAMSATKYVLIRVPASMDDVPHPTPQRQVCVVLEGEIEVTTSDGEARRFASGACLLMEDTIGEGHVTQNTTGKEGLVMMVHLV